MSEVIPLYSVTWAEAHEAKSRGANLEDWEGHQIRPAQFNTDPLDVLKKHSFAVAKAIAAGKSVPKAVRAEYKERCMQRGLSEDHAHRAAFAPAKTAKLVNAKGKPFSWSFSALQDFNGCPKRYAHQRFYCDVQAQDSEAIRWGNRVHEVAEKELKGQAHNDPEAFALVKPYTDLFKQAQGAKYAEFEIALDENLRPVKWFDGWYRGKLDVLLVQDNHAKIYDYKTGKPKDDPEQLKTFAATLSIVRPEIEQFTAKFIWLKDKSVSSAGLGTLGKQDTEKIWEDLLKQVDRVKKAWESGIFPAKPSGLCPWCPAYAGCVYKRG